MAAGALAPGVLADGAGALPVCGAAAFPASCAGLAIWLCASCAARCFSICGMLKKYCQPSSTSPDRMTARMVLRLSVIVQVSSFISIRAWRQSIHVLTRFLDVNRFPLRSKTLLTVAKLAGLSDGAPCGDHRAYWRSLWSAPHDGRPVHSRCAAALIPVPTALPVREACAGCGCARARCRSFW